MYVEVPTALEAQRRLGPVWGAWLDDLPRRVSHLVEEWELTPDGAAMHGYCSLVLPVRTPDGSCGVLKVGLPDDEGEHEHLALQHWRGQGAVQLLRADPRRRAMLLERLHQRTLAALPNLEACGVVASLYPRLHIPSLPQLRTLTWYIGRWTEDLARLPRSAPVPRRLVEQALSLGSAFLDDPASTGVMIHGDLHYDNVLAGDREPWLVIDPKPVSGDPHYELAPMLWNRWEEIAGPLRAVVRRRFHTLVDAAGLDEDRARAWVVVRVVHNAMWCLQDADGALSEEDRRWLTVCVAVAKAVQD